MSAASRISDVRLAIACGGTGGHFYPTLAIADAFRARGGAVVLVVAGHHADDQLRLASERGFPAVPMSAVRLPRAPLSVLAFPFRFASAVLAARGCLRRARPDVVLGMGSFAAAPTCIAALTLGISLVLHEGNSWMGRTNRWLSRWARAVATSLPLSPDCRPGCRTVRTGMPLRDALLEAAAGEPDPAGAREHYGLTAKRPTLLVFGGSQGASFINDLLLSAAPLLGKHAQRLQLIHFTGTDDNQALKDSYERHGLRARVSRADPRIEHAYLAAGLVVCRGGASSLSELALFGKPSVIIPLPAAAENHQWVNAGTLAAQGAVQVVEQSDMSARALADIVDSWLDAPESFVAMGEAVRALAMPHAAEAVVRLVAEVAGVENGVDPAERIADESGKKEV